MAIVAAAFFGKNFLTNFSTNQVNHTLGAKLTGKDEKGKLISKFVVISDTHSDNDETKKAFAQAKALGAQYAVHTGDWTTVGTIAELQAQKSIFDQAGLAYWGVLGDHDLWQSGTKNFEKVFGKPYESFNKNGIHHILLDASDTDKGLGEKQLAWLERDLAENKEPVTLVFMHLPPYHPYSSRTIWEKGGANTAVKTQVNKFLDLIKGKVNHIFAGDHHFYQNYTEPATGVKITISGAATRERNLQEPRFSLVEVYEGGEIEVSDEIIN